jgi:hypothetical protein
MKVQISSIVENQFPSFLRTEAPLLVEFIKQYYISQEVKGAPELRILQNKSLLQLYQQIFSLMIRQSP